MRRKSTEHFMIHYSAPDLIGVEVGAGMGVNAETLLGNIRFKKLFLVENNYWGSDCKSVLINKFSNHPVVENILIPSVEAATKFLDGYFDFIYIDADHQYQNVEDDINAWYGKLKTGGWMYFHDYDSDVKRAVTEFFIQGKNIYPIEFTEQEQGECGVRKV